MNRVFVGALIACMFSGLAYAHVQPFPSNFQTQEITTNGATIHVRVGGSGRARHVVTARSRARN
jgi:hypothetical protein